jgi:TPR repeat protein
MPMKSIIFLLVGLFSILHVPSSRAETDLAQCQKANISEKYIEAFPFCLRAAEAGDSEAQRMLANLYDNDKSGVKKDAAESLKWLRKSAEQGNDNACIEFGDRLREGIKYTGLDYAEVLKCHLSVADKGNINAMLNLVVFYSNGSATVKKDETQAIKWLNEAIKAAEIQGHAAALKDIAFGFKDGNLIKQDLEKANYLLNEAIKAAENKGDAKIIEEIALSFKEEQDKKKANSLFLKASELYRKAAEQGYASAQISLGDMYLKGKGVRQDGVEAVKWFRKSAEQGNADAQYRLGQLYAGGKHVTQNYKDAIIWYRKAAEQNHREAIGNIGSMYLLGNGVTKDCKESAKWYLKYYEDSVYTTESLAMIFDGSGCFAEAAFFYLKPAEKGSAEAQNNLGRLYYSGKGVAQDYTEAAKWYLMAAEKGSSNSQFRIGLMYNDGKGVKQDYKEAEKWFRKAANRGNASSQAQLGNLYYLGQGVDKDFNSAVYWYKKAADQDDDDAQANLALMYRKGEGVPKNYAESVKLYQKSAEQGNAMAQWGFGLAYEFGDGLPVDKVQALAWLTLAATNETRAVEFRDSIEKELKPNEVIKAQQLATKLQTEIDKRQEQKYSINTDQKTHSKQSARTLFPSLSPTPTAKPAFTPNDIAIIIGIEKYRTVPPTEYAAADAGMVRDYLKALGITDRNIEFLADDRATLSDIRKVIETKLPNMVKASSRVIVYYAGHGAPGTARGESYLVPYDGDPSFLADTAYPLSRLYDRLSRLQAKEVLVILDSCFSGAGGRSVLAKNTRPLVMVKDTPLPASKKMIVLTSSRGSQITTSLSEVGHGAFTYFFLRALQEGNRDIGEVYAYLNPRVTEEAKRQNVDQTPTINPAPDKLKGRFLFAR